MKKKIYKINRNAHEVRLYIIDSSAIYPLNNNRMIYTRGKSKIDGPADTKYRTKYELLPRHAHEGASPFVPIFSSATAEKSQYTYIALLLYYIAPLIPPPPTYSFHLHKPFSDTSPPASGLNDFRYRRQQRVVG